MFVSASSVADASIGGLYVEVTFLLGVPIVVVVDGATWSTASVVVFALGVVSSVLLV